MMILRVLLVILSACNAVSLGRISQFTRSWKRASTRVRILQSLAHSGPGSFEKERCVLVAVDRTSTSQQSSTFSTEESLVELSELCSTASLEVVGTCVQRLPVPNPRSFFGEGKLKELRNMCSTVGARVVVVDEDLSPRQQRSLENTLKNCHINTDYVVPVDEPMPEPEEDAVTSDNDGGVLVSVTGEVHVDESDSVQVPLDVYTGERHHQHDSDEPPPHSITKARRAKAAYQEKQPDAESESVAIKVLDRTAVILDIFAQHAKSREGQLQVELAMLQYRSTRGPNVASNANGNSDNTIGDGKGSSGAGLRGPGETKLELDKRKIKTRIKLLEDEIARLEQQRQTQRRGRGRLGAPLVALVGYTNAGKSTLLNKLSNAGVLAEDMLFATLDTTTRKIRLPSHHNNSLLDAVTPDNQMASEHDVERRRLGMDVMLTDTVGFISKLPSHIVAAFRATLESVADADILIHVCDRSNPAWQKQRAVVMQELDRIAERTGHRAPIVEFFNKVDRLPAAELEEALNAIRNQPIEMELVPATPITHSKHKDLHALAATAAILTQQPDTLTPSTDDDDELSSIAYLPDDVTKADDQRNKVSAAVAAIPAPPVDRNIVAGNTRKKRRQKHALHVPEETTESILEKHLLQKDGEVCADHVTAELSHITVPEVLQVQPSKVRLYATAGSAVTGQGLDDLIARLEDALTADYETVQCFIPYAQDVGVVSDIMTNGVIQAVEYSETGTALRCKVPSHVADKLSQFRV